MKRMADPRRVESLKSWIRSVIARSQVPEDPIHAENTLKWLLTLDPKADEALRVAALGHDIERAMEHLKIRRADYRDYDAFKAAHARNSAEILSKKMRELGMPEDVTEEVYSLVLRHETGGDERADLLRDADSLSFFDVNLPHYLQREGMDEAYRRCLYGCRRISRDRRKWLDTIVHDDARAAALMQKLRREGVPEHS